MVKEREEVREGERRGWLALSHALLLSDPP